MSRADRIIGLLRSLAIYHAIPLRQRRLRRLYAQLVSRQLAGNRAAFEAHGKVPQDTLDKLDLPILP